jgi:hypothetical protein
MVLEHQELVAESEVEKVGLVEMLEMGRNGIWSSSNSVI